MSNYSLDVVFNSATTALNTTPPNTGAPPPPIYAMGYGFAMLPSGGTAWSDDGQQVETIPAQSTFYISVYDTAPSPSPVPTVSQISITFFDPDNPGVQWNYAPLVTTGEKNMITNPTFGPPAGSDTDYKQTSVGCNVKNAAVWWLGPYTVSLPEGLKVLTLACTVEVTVESDPGNTDNITKVFSVDPEIQVDGGGGG